MKIMIQKPSLIRTIYLPYDLAERIEKLAQENKLSWNEVARQALRNLLEGKEQKLETKVGKN